MGKGGTSKHNTEKAVFAAGVGTATLGIALLRIDPIGAAVMIGSGVTAAVISSPLRYFLRNEQAQRVTA